MADTTFDKAIKLREEFEASRKAAIDDLLAQRKEIERRLATLGYKDPRKSGKPCPVCGEPGHDRRRHRPAPTEPAVGTKSAHTGGGR